MAAKFQIKKTPKGEFQFLLLGPTGRVVVSSDSYRTKAACVNGIASARKAAAGATVEDQTTREWLDREAANTPVSKAARVAGRAVGKAKAVVEELLAPPSPAPAGRTPARTAAATRAASTSAAAKKATPAKKAAKAAKATEAEPETEEGTAQ